MRTRTFAELHRAAALAGALALAGTGCALLLEFDPEGFACEDTSECLSGWVCSSAGRCVEPGSGACTPACGPFEKCVADVCEAHCSLDGRTRACPAGQLCEAGACTAAPKGSLGEACLSDEDCTIISEKSTCLLPYYGLNSAPEGSRTGFCTQSCRTDGECGGSATTCSSFGGETAVNPPFPLTQLCAPPSFLACNREDECTASGLTCGVYALRFPTLRVVRACRQPTTATGRNVGEVCSPAIACRNGLCLPDDGGVNRVCAMPCGADADCDASMPEAGARCLVAMLDLASEAANPTPKLRTPVCVPGGQSLLLNCTANATTCNLDAPHCVSFNGGADSLCAPGCAEPDAAQRCPTTARSCETVGDGDYCGP